ncbi:hypothetical protein DOTSEDRAFT_70974 [Dothistroma septosporum NZE10]|uniref:Uncharacterized protein n=1 Tax=Dothistroma septosporum (strain NZE10 / CBS 128990) TaxID=675120 RepID=N1PRR6_DOTSN|nr:hypothetical protein DOTSEDRAFT_70974 [Dothistroma septosporum NZE10]
MTCGGDWLRLQAKHRIMFSPRIDDGDFVVPDLENLVNFEREHPSVDRTTIRADRMARMCGQHGYYMSIAPSIEFLTQRHLGQFPKGLGVWRPKSRDETGRHSEGRKHVKRLHDKNLCHGG